MADGALPIEATGAAAARQLRRLARVASETSNAVVITDDAGRIEWVNEGFFRMTGYRLEDVAGRTPGQVLQGPDTDAGEIARIRAALRAGRGFESELINYDREGHAYWVEIRCSPLYDRSGRLEGFIAFESDVTGRKRMEENLRLAVAEAERTRFALDQHAIVSVTDAAGNILYANRKFEQISGYTAQELIGRNHRLLKSGRHPDSFYREMWETIASGRVWQGILCNRRRDGGLYWVESTIVPFLDDHGVPYQYVSVRTDVTALMELETRLRAERDFSDAAINAIPGTFYVVARNGAILRLNESLSRLTGYPVEEILRMGALDFIPPADREKVQAAIGRCFETGHAQVESALLCRDGRTIPFYFQAARFEHEGRPVLIGTGTDISDIRAMQEELAQREERLRRSQVYANIGTWDWNIQTGELFWSERIPCLFGYPEGALETSYENFLAAVHPEDRQRVIEAVNACVERDLPYEIEHRVVWPDGTVRWLLERGAVTRAPDGRPLHMLGVVQDIHARKLAERAVHESRGRLEEAQRIARLGNWEANLITGELHWSDQIYAIFGYDPATFTPSVEAFYEAVHPDDMPLVRASEARALETGIHDVVHRIVRPDGEVRWVRELAELSRDAEGRPLRLTGTVQDVTALKQTELELVRAKEQAGRASHAKSEFLSSMSHELRTPLNAILGFAQLLEMDAGLPPEHRQAADEILKAGQHLLELINDVLDLAKVEAGRVELSLEPVACSELLAECGRLVEGMAQQRGIALQIGDAPLTVRADRVRLKQVLLNLLSNAIKYNRAEGQVSVEATVQGGRVRLAVRDTGPGIPPARQAELFQAFNRLGAERTEVEGTGIGLVITRRLVEMMGGHMGVESTPGQGSTFWIELPEANAEPVAAPVPAVVSAGKQAACAQERVVLYVEDNPANQRLMTQLLARRPGIRLLTAHTASLAVELAAAHRPDLVLMDINLPGADGYAALRDMRSQPGLAAVPAVAVSANATPRDIERGLAAGFADYLTKPLDVPRFFDVVDRLLAQERGGQD